MARIFIAIDAPPEVREELVRLQGILGRRLGDSVRLTTPSNLHGTLIFLGEIDEIALESTRRIVRELAPAPAAPLTLGPAGVFPERGPVSVVWVGLIDREGRLGSLVSTLRRHLEVSGFTPENRAFIPHLTVARCRREGGREAEERIREVTGALAPRPIRFAVTAVTLYRSEGSPAGSRYTPLEVVPLGAVG